jgi:3-hydroxyisobutyrate dehydrogenase-like beta-hydroxyacid dehydrogenase
MTAVAIIGMGAMGRRFAGRLLAAGHDVVVWNRTPAKAAELVGRGAAAAASPADATRRAEAVITAVSDPAALHAVTEGPDGIAAGIDGSTTVIEMSTVGPETVRWLAAALPVGTDLLDAPVLGSVSEAEEGTLQVFVGGPAPLVERWAPLLAELGSPIHVGPLGAGASAKLVANATLFGTITVLGEVVSLADRLGLSRDVTFQVLAATPLAGPAERRRPSIEDGDYPLRFALSLARKDAELIVEAARAAGVDVRVLEAARTWLADAEDSDEGDRDYSSVLARIVESD